MTLIAARVLGIYDHRPAELPLDDGGISRSYVTDDQVQTRMDGVSNNINQGDPRQTERRVAAVVVPKHLHREVQTFVEQLMAKEADADSYSSFLEKFLAGATSGSKQVTTRPEPGASGGDVVEIGYES